jgi:hypothetical protein
MFESALGGKFRRPDNSKLRELHVISTTQQFCPAFAAKSRSTRTVETVQKTCQKSGLVLWWSKVQE